METLKETLSQPQLEALNRLASYLEGFLNPIDQGGRELIENTEQARVLEQVKLKVSEIITYCLMPNLLINSTTPPSLRELISQIKSKNTIFLHSSRRELSFINKIDSLMEQIESALSNPSLELAPPMTLAGKVAPDITRNAGFPFLQKDIPDIMKAKLTEDLNEDNAVSRLFIFLLLAERYAGIKNNADFPKGYLTTDYENALQTVGNIGLFQPMMTYADFLSPAQAQNIRITDPDNILFTQKELDRLVISTHPDPTEQGIFLVEPVGETEEFNEQVHQRLSTFIKEATHITLKLREVFMKLEKAKAFHKEYISNQLDLGLVKNRPSALLKGKAKSVTSNLTSFIFLAQMEPAELFFYINQLSYIDFLEYKVSLAFSLKSFGYKIETFNDPEGFYLDLLKQLKVFTKIVLSARLKHFETNILKVIKRRLACEFNKTMYRHGVINPTSIVNAKGKPAEETASILSHAFLPYLRYSMPKDQYKSKVMDTQLEVKFLPPKTG